MTIQRFRRALLSALIVSGAVALHAQSMAKVDEASARERLLKHEDPIYPPIAMAAHVTGDVVLAVEIGANGHVTHVKTVSGPPMLVGAASDAVESWRFQPFSRTAHQSQ